MRVLMLSLDKKILESDSPVQKRLVALAERTGEITVFVPDRNTTRESVTPELTVFGVGGMKPRQFLRLWGKAIRELQAKKYDLITVQDVYFLAFLGAKLSERSRVPFEVQVHGFEKLSGPRERIARYVLHRANKIRVVSERLKKLLTTHYSLPTTKIYELPVYTQMGERGEMGRKRKKVPYPFTFLTVGRLVPVKNISMQIRALAALSQKIPHVRLRIVGGGPLMESLKLQVASLKLENKVSFEGEQEELGKYYEEADAFLLTSDSEGWGVAVLEAAAHKLPIIMTDVGLAREVIRNEENGLIIKTGDEEELMRAMQELIEHPELRERLGEAAYKAFSALPSKEEQIQKQVSEWGSLR